MANPTNLTELAESLAESAKAARQRAQDSTVVTYRANAMGYADALIDTRATVLAMITDIDRRIAQNNQVITLGPGAAEQQALLDGRIEAYEDVRGFKDHEVSR
jgi:hypothetical protein